MHPHKFGRKEKNGQNLNTTNRKVTHCLYGDMLKFSSNLKN